MRRIKYALITADYDYETNDINLYSRNEKGEKKVIKVLGFEPYFYIPQDEEIYGTGISRREDVEILAIDEQKLSKVTTEKPRDVKQLRSKVRKHYEADILFPRRMLIDTKIFYGFEIPEGKTMVHWDHLKPVETEVEPRKVFCDIETFSKGRRFPLPTDKDAKVTVNCLYDSFSKKYLSLIISKHEKVEKLSENHIVMYVKDEESLLNKTMEFLVKIDPDIFTAWHLPFDQEYIDERVKTYRKKLPWNRVNAFDLLRAYKKLYHKSDNTLANIVKEEELDVPNYQPYKHEMWEKEDLTEAILTNKSHVEAIVMLDEKKRILDFYWDLKKVVGLESLDDTIFHGRLVDIMLLRYYHNKWVLPSNPSGEEKKRRKHAQEEKVGGKVLTPPWGIFDNLAVFDMSRYYPEMLISQNLSPEPHARGELGITPKMLLDLINVRLRYDRQLAKLDPGTPEWKELKFQRNSVKFVTESVIGYFGSESSRICDIDGIFNPVTTMGQRGLLFLRKVCNKDNNKVIYGDTDGLSVQTPSVEYAIKYVDTLNNYLKDFCKEEKISRELTLKLDRFYSVYGIKKITERVGGKTIERGVKKRYFGKISWEDGKYCDYLAIKGFEYVRRDAPPITKKIQPTIFDFILNKKPEKVKDYLRTEVGSIKRKNTEKKLSINQLAIPVTLNQPISAYGGLNKNGKQKGTPDYVRGSIYSNEWFGTEIRGGDQVRMVYVKNIKGYPKTDVISYLTKEDLPEGIEVDIDKMIDRCIRSKVDEVIELIGLDWDSIFSKTRNLLEVV